jgi:hypothetical protein
MILPCKPVRKCCARHRHVSLVRVSPPFFHSADGRLPICRQRFADSDRGVLRAGEIDTPGDTDRTLTFTSNDASLAYETVRASSAPGPIQGFTPLASASCFSLPAMTSTHGVE